MSAKIDTEIKKLTDKAYKDATAILTKLRSKLDILATELIKKETIEADDFVVLSFTSARYAG